MHVISACADQAELINRSLPSDVINNPYHITDVLPGGKDNLSQQKYTNGFSRGGKREMAPLIGLESPVYSTLEEVVWEGNPTVFGKVVSLKYQSFFAIILIYPTIPKVPQSYHGSARWIMYWNLSQKYKKCLLCCKFAF